MDFSKLHNVTLPRGFFGGKFEDMRSEIDDFNDFGGGDFQEEEEPLNFNFYKMNQEELNPSLKHKFEESYSETQKPINTSKV